MSNSCVLKHCKNFILTGNTVRVCYWCHAICQLLKTEMPSFSPPGAQGCGEAHRQQSHTQTSWHLSSSALAAAASLQPLPSSWSRSLHVGESWERPARHSGGWGFTVPQHCCLHCSLWAPALLTLSNWCYPSGWQKDCRVIGGVELLTVTIFTFLSFSLWSFVQPRPACRSHCGEQMCWGPERRGGLGTRWGTDFCLKDPLAHGVGRENQQNKKCAQRYPVLQSSTGLGAVSGGGCKGGTDWRFSLCEGHCQSLSFCHIHPSVLACGKVRLGTKRRQCLNTQSCACRVLFRICGSSVGTQCPLSHLCASD